MLENHLSDLPQDFHPVVIHHDGVADAVGDLREGEFAPGVRPVVLSQAQIDGRAVDCAERIVKSEPVPRSAAMARSRVSSKSAFFNLHFTFCDIML